MLIDNYFFTKNEQFDQSIWRNQKPQIGQIITENDICFHSPKDKVFFNTLTTEEKRRFLSVHLKKTPSCLQVGDELRS